MKAILVIDFPTDCFMCPCFSDGTWRCCATEIDEEVHDGRPKWCPLRPLPQELDNISVLPEDPNNWSLVHYESLGYEEGWNACLYEITGETE